MCYSCGTSILRRHLILPIKEFPSLVLPRFAIMLQDLIIQFTCCYLSSGRLKKVKNKRKYQSFSSKSGRSCLKRWPLIRGSNYIEIIVLCLENFWYFGKLLVFWKTGCLGEVVAYERWSPPQVHLYLNINHYYSCLVQHDRCTSAFIINR